MRNKRTKNHLSEYDRVPTMIQFDNRIAGAPRSVIRPSTAGELRNRNKNSARVNSIDYNIFLYPNLQDKNDLIEYMEYTGQVSRDDDVFQTDQLTILSELFEKIKITLRIIHYLFYFKFIFNNQSYLKSKVFYGNIK